MTTLELGDWVEITNGVSGLPAGSVGHVCKVRPEHVMLTDTNCFQENWRWAKWVPIADVRRLQGNPLGAA